MPRESKTIASAPILRWAHGGDGVALPEGRVVFVPEVVPGDVVDLAVVEDRGRFARAHVTRLVTPSAQRVTPPCPVQARCGGCPWMIGSVEAQAESREAILRGEVRKRLGADVHVEMARATTRDEAFGYRQRVRLTYRSDGSGIDGVRLGYLARASHDLVDIPGCPIADARIEALLPALRAELAGVRGEGKVTLLAGDEGVAGWIEPAEAREGAGRVWGREAVTVRIGGFAQVLSARAFAQANARVTGDILQMIGAVADEVAREGRGKRALELYAGSGTLTQALWSRGWEVEAYELDSAARPAFEAARAALDGSGAWHACDLASGLVRPPPRDPEGIDLVLLDPPRTGAAAIVPWLRASRARTIIYVSCDIATGLRDLSTLTGDGRWRIDRVVGFDMFPHTGHQEMVSVARRK